MKLHALVPFSSQEEVAWPNDGEGWREGKRTYGGSIRLLFNFG